MQYLVAALICLPATLLVVGAIRGRVTVTSCCAVDAEHDGRMASAYAESPEPVTSDRAAD